MEERIETVVDADGAGISLNFDAAPAYPGVVTLVVRQARGEREIEVALTRYEQIRLGRRLLAAAIIPYGAKGVRLAELLDEHGSLRPEIVEWRETERGLETKINGSVLTVQSAPSGGPTPTWSGYVAEAFVGYRADSPQEVQGYLLQRAAC